MADNNEGGTDQAPDKQQKQPQSSARAKAEARRRRILEASSDRMGVVAGEVPKPSAAAADEGGGDGDDEAPAPPSEKPSGASKYAQARRRRFQKKAAAKPADDDAGGRDGDAAAAAAADAESTKPEKEGPTVAAVAAEGTAETAAAADNDGTDKKKYMGVAKMRRKKLAEKKRQEEEEKKGGGGGGAAAYGTTDEAGGRRSPSGRKLGVPPSLSTVATVRQRRGPILLNLITVLMLFLAGYGVGVQNSPASVGGYNEGVIIETGLSPAENGIGALSLLRAAGTVDEEGTKDARERLLDESAELADDESAQDDEFGDVAGAGESGSTDEKPRGADIGKVPNIDPLFRVDLDEVTAGPGLLMAAARLAVQFHRFLMYLILVLPMSVVRSVLVLPQALVASPPVLFVVSVVIRYVGRDVLGARLPDVDAIVGQDSGDKTSGDLLTSLIKSVRAQVSATFPRMSSAFTILRDAKSDMYVVLCGLFVGLVLPVQMGGAPGGEEL